MKKIVVDYLNKDFRDWEVLSNTGCNTRRGLVINLENKMLIDEDVVKIALNEQRDGVFRGCSLIDLVHGDVYDKLAVVLLFNGSFGKDDRSVDH